MMFNIHVKQILVQKEIQNVIIHLWCRIYSYVPTIFFHKSFPFIPGFLIHRLYSSFRHCGHVILKDNFKFWTLQWYIIIMLSFQFFRLIKNNKFFKQSKREWRHQSFRSYMNILFVSFYLKKQSNTSVLNCI